MTHTHRIASLLMVATSLTTGAIAQTQEASPRPTRGSSLYTASSSYMGFNAGQTDFRLNSGTGLFPTDNRSTSYNLYAGSYFNNQNLGFEVGYTDFGKVNRGGGSTKADGINLSLIGRAPLSRTFNLLGKIGTTYGRTETSSAAGSGVSSGTEVGFDWSYGVGAEYAFSPQWSGVVQYDEHYLKYSGSGRDRISILALGVRYHY